MHCNTPRNLHHAPKPATRPKTCHAPPSQLHAGEFLNPILSGVYGLSKADYHKKQEESLEMSDHNVRELFTELLAIDWPTDSNSAPWRRLGLTQPPNQSSEIRQQAQRLLEQLQAARGNYPLELLQEAARQIKLAARESLLEVPGADTNTHTAMPVNSQPMAQSRTTPAARPVAQPVAQSVAQPVAQSVAQPVAQPVAQVVAQPVAQVVAQPVAQPVATTVGISLGVTPGKRIRSSRSRSSWTGWALAAGFAGLAVLGTLWWVQRDTPWLVFEPNPIPPTQDVSPNNPAAQPTTPSESAVETAIKPPNIADLPPTATNDSPTDSDRSTAIMTPPAPIGSLDEASTDPPVDEALPSKPTPEADQDTAATDDATFLVVARQFELARVFLAAGRVAEAQTAWEAGRQRAAGQAIYQPADNLLEQLFAWRKEIYETAGQRLSLLNRVGEIPVDDTFVSVINASNEGLVVRAAGQRREFSPSDLPWNLVRGILEVTSGPDEGTDRLRQVVTDGLRVHQATNEQLEEWRQAITTIGSSTTDSTGEYSAAKLELMFRYLEANKRISKFIVDPPTLTPLATDVWEPQLASSRRELLGDRTRLQAYRDQARPRFEIEAELWQTLESTKQSTVTGQLLTLHWVAIERAELPFYLDNLRTLQQVINLEPDHALWRDSARSFAQRANGDAQLVEWLKLIQAHCTDDWSLAATTVVGLQSFAKQLATQIKDRVQRQAWTREFD